MEVVENSSNSKRKKRNLPGMPADPDAQVIVLSPKTLMATNRFVCEICGKGFQREQNLELHRRGHNLPWKLRQRSSSRRRVYVCPEHTCVHHHPSRALGDLTGIKKHFSRKHGEKKWKCDKCSRKYAVHSDWKAHVKTCGTRDYTCDCGTVFSRRDSFITHRAFCDALAQETAKLQPPSPPHDDTSSHNQNRHSELAENDSSACINGNSGSSSNSNHLFANILASSTIGGCLQPQSSSFSDLVCAMAVPECPAGLLQGSSSQPTSLTLSSTGGSTLFALEDGRQFAPPPEPTMSATALLQKAAQMGAAPSSGSFLRGLGVSLNSSDCQQDRLTQSTTLGLPGLGLGVPCDINTRLTELMMSPSTFFGSEPTTLDFLGLGMGQGGNGTSKGAFSALLTSIEGDLDITQSFRLMCGKKKM